MYTYVRLSSDIYSDSDIICLDIQYLLIQYPFEYFTNSVWVFWIRFGCSFGYQVKCPGLIFTGIILRSFPIILHRESSFLGWLASIQLCFFVYTIKICRSVVYLSISDSKSPKHGLTSFFTAFLTEYTIIAVELRRWALHRGGICQSGRVFEQESKYSIFFIICNQGWHFL